VPEWNGSRVQCHVHATKPPTATSNFLLTVTVLRVGRWDHKISDTGSIKCRTEEVSSFLLTVNHPPFHTVLYCSYCSQILSSGSTSTLAVHVYWPEQQYTVHTAPSPPAMAVPVPWQYTVCTVSAVPRCYDPQLCVAQIHRVFCAHLEPR
jgi:hypothetical protein